jgi:hypothetical protein
MDSLLKLPDKLGRSYLQFIDAEYIANKLKKRRGACKKCGDCCRHCRLLGKDNLCTVYEKRPFLCYREFPLDRLDQKIWEVKDCGYTFVE